MLGDRPFDKSNNHKLNLFGQFNPHLNLLKRTNILFHRNVTLAKRDDPEVELLL